MTNLEDTCVEQFMGNLSEARSPKPTRLPMPLPMPLPIHTIVPRVARSSSFHSKLPPLPVHQIPTVPHMVPPHLVPPPPPGSGLHSISSQSHMSSGRERVITLVPEIAPLSASDIISRELSVHAVPFNTDIRRLIRSEAPSLTVQRLMKRLLDLAGSVVALILLSPVFVGLALAVKFDSRGPILFSQKRVGKNGRLFKFYKFRSMVTDAEKLKKTLLAKNEADGPAFKMKHDPRVTRVGRFIRKTSLDELPQLYNVLRGDMSLVGPRPALPDEVAKWKPWQHKRLAVEQGCTCIWQVSGRSDVNFDQWMKMDLEYVRTWSLTRDLSIIMRTVLVMLTGKGAY